MMVVLCAFSHLPFSFLQVYVENIPIEYQTSAALKEFFENAYPGCVIDAHLAMMAPNLKKKVAERDALVLKLEHNINIRDVTGVVPQAKNMITRHNSGSVIQKMGEELYERNKVITESIDTLIENANNIQAVSADDGSDLGDLDDSFQMDQTLRKPKDSLDLLERVSRVLPRLQPTLPWVWQGLSRMWAVLASMSLDLVPTWPCLLSCKKMGKILPLDLWFSIPCVRFMVLCKCCKYCTCINHLEG